MLFGQLLNIHRIFKWLAKALIRLCVCAGWSEHLLVAHTTLLEISCRGSIMCFLGWIVLNTLITWVSLYVPVHEISYCISEQPWLGQVSTAMLSCQILHSLPIHKKCGSAWRWTLRQEFRLVAPLNRCIYTFIFTFSKQSFNELLDFCNSS